MSDNTSVVQKGINQLNIDEAGKQDWEKGGDWLMIIENQTGSDLTWADAHEDSSETPFRTIRPGINVAHISGTSFSFSARYVGGGRSFSIAVSNPLFGSKKVNIHEQAVNAKDAWETMNDGNDKASTHGSRAFLARYGKYYIWGFVLSGSVPQSAVAAPLNTWSEIAWVVKSEADRLSYIYHVYFINHTGQTLQLRNIYEDSGEFARWHLHPGWNCFTLRDSFSMAACYTGDGCVYRIAFSNPLLGEKKIAISEDDGDLKKYWESLNDGGDKTAPKGSRAYIREVMCSVMNETNSNSMQVSHTVWVFELAKHGG